MTRCKVCGKPLRNPESIARGMGPDCERRVIGVVRGLSVAMARPKRAKGSAEYEPKGLLAEED